MLHSSTMLRRLAVLGVALVLGLGGCGSAPLLTVATHTVTVEPNANSTAQQANIGYTVGAPAHIDISLLGPKGQRVLLRNNDRSADSYSFPFSGVLAKPNSPDQQVLADGTYRLLFQAKAKDGRTAQASVTAIVAKADPVALQLSNLSLSLSTFSPNGQGVQQLASGATVNQDQTVLNYAVNKPADITIWVTDAKGNRTPVHNQLAMDTKPGPQPPVIWDGKGPNGVPVPDGKYVLHVQAADASGNVTERDLPVTVVNSGIQQVQIVDARFFPTALGYGGVVNVAITIKNTGTAAIHTMGPPPGTRYTTQMKGYLDPSFALPGNPTPFVDTPGRWRVGVRWTSGDVNYPARWGFFANPNQTLLPNQQVTVIGSITILPPQPHNINLWATIDMGGIGNTGDFGQTQVIVGFPS